MWTAELLDEFGVFMHDAFPDAEITLKRYPMPPDEFAALLKPARP